MRNRAPLTLVLVLLAGTAWADARQPAVDGDWSASDYGALYAQKTDQELTQLTASWEALAPEQKRALLNEVKLRMIRQRDRSGGPAVLTARRFGRLVRQPDGSLVRIETQVLRVTPGRGGYGVGFEIRAQRRSSAAAPVDRAPWLEPLDVPIRVGAPAAAGDRDLPIVKASDPQG